MLFRQLFDSSSCTYTYLLASNVGQQAIIIDPVLEKLGLYEKLLKELDLKLAYCLDTHVHADHITAAGKLREATNCKIALSEQAATDCMDIKLKDGDMIRAQGLALETRYTPGHTNDSVCFVMPDRVFTGDTLFIRGTGRTDFQHGNPQEAYISITEKLFTLADDILVYPGHDYNGMTVSTIGEEKRFNPRLAKVESADEYAAIMNALNLPNPKLIDIAVPANLKCGNN